MCCYATPSIQLSNDKMTTKRLENLILRLIVFGIFCAMSYQCKVSKEVNPLYLVSNDPSDSLMVDYFQSKSIPTFEGNQVKLLTSGKVKFDDLFAHIKEAKHHIHMEYFNFRDDTLSMHLFELLEAKAKEGVKIRILFDDFGNISNNKPLREKHLKKIRARGVEIFRFDRIRFPWVNHVVSRDHRKIVIIDGQIGYMGGMNVANYYVNGLKGIGAWRDMHLRMEGPAVSELQRIFCDMWYRTTKQKIQEEAYFPKVEPKLEEEGGKLLSIVDRVPHQSPKSIREAYINAINFAKSRIRIVNPYFLPTSSLKKAIVDAINRGVKVEIMVSQKCDIPFTPDAMKHQLHKLVQKGVKVWLYVGGFQHAKIMTVDNLFCTVGSANLNSRSLRYDFECNAFIFDKSITAELDTIFNEDINSSIDFDQKFWDNRSSWSKFVGFFANLFSPIL